MNKNTNEIRCGDNTVELDFTTEISKTAIVEAPAESVASLVVDTQELSQEQLRAVELLGSGHSVTEVAASVGVGRATIYRWLKSDAVFVAAYQHWQQDVLDRARGRLLSLSGLAVGAIEKALERDDEKVAISVLQKLGVLKGPSGR